ncbi:MAG: CHASE3 domain-containing protein [Bacteroidetes bacterium]|nr:CHASE3 domain-containing protein [Bacteroidota bacterium]
MSSPLRYSNRERRVLRLLYAVTLAVLVLFLLITARTFFRYSTANRHIRDSNAVLQELEALVSGLKDAQIGVRGYMLTGDTAFARPFQLAQPMVAASMHRLDSLQRAGATNLDLAPIQDLSRKVLKSIQDQFLAQRGLPPGLHGRGKAQMGQTRDLMERIRAEQGQLATALNKVRNRNLGDERSLQPDTPLMLLIYSVLTILATGLLFWRLVTALTKADKAEAEVQRKVDELNKEVRTREFAERSLKRVLDSSPSAIMAFRSIRDAKGRVTDFEWHLANQESERIFAPGGGGLVGQRLLVQMPWVREAGLYEAFLDVVETGEPYEATRQSVLRADTWIHVHALRLLDGFVVTISDISDTRRAEQLLAEADRLAITGGIARTIAHEVRNPLTNLHMALEQMLDELQPGVREEIKPYSEILQRNMHRISKLITDLLESSKPKELDKQPCAVQGLLETAVASVQDRLGLRKMQARVEVSPGVQSVLADPEMMGIALTNLCVNAIEAMEEGAGRLLLSADLHRGHVRIRVVDNGKGIPGEDIRRLFHAFYSGRSGGMGLGLTSARTIFNAHGVHVDVESTVGEGTTFVLTFPEEADSPELHTEAPGG